MACARISPAEYERQRVACTQEQLAALVNDPAFHAWQLRKAAASNRARAATNVLATAACVLLVVALMLLRPAATGPAPAQVAHSMAQAATMSSPAAPILAPPDAATTEAPDPAIRQQLEAAKAESAAAWDAVAERELALRLAEQERAEAAARAATLEALAARAEERRAAEAAQQADTAQRAADAEARLAAMEEEVRQAQAAAAAAAALAEATAAVAAALAEPLPDAQQAAATQALQVAATAAKPAPAAWALDADRLAQLGLPAPLAEAVVAGLGALSGPGAALGAAGAAALCAALAALVYWRDRRALAAQAARAAGLAARLKEASFARDTAEKGLELLEGELQRRMKQLEEVQQEARDAASPRIGTTPQPAALTPGRGELPPPPARLVEKFLKDHNFMAVAHDQMQEWLEMEQGYRQMAGALEELQAALAEREEALAGAEQDLAAAEEAGQAELRAREEQLAQARAWLDEAQDELLTTQGALAEREAECRRVTAQLEALRAVATDAQEAACSLEGRDADLLQQNLALAAQLATVTAAYEEARAAAAGAGSALAAFGTTASRPASAASTVPGTPADLTREVASCLELMRATRAQLADRLAHSQGVCEQMIAECQLGAGGSSAAEVPQAEPEATAGAFGSPAAAASPAGSERHAEAAEAAEPGVLALSPRHHPNLPQASSPSPAKHASSGWAGSSCSPGASGGSAASSTACGGGGGQGPAWKAAARVAEVRARHTSWDLAGFVADLGFQIDEAPIPVERSEFEALRERALGVLAAAAQRGGEERRALAGAAAQALRDWEWPVQRINTPPPSPFWAALGLRS